MLIIAENVSLSKLSHALISTELARCWAIFYFFLNSSFGNSIRKILSEDNVSIKLSTLFIQRNMHLKPSKSLTLGT